LAKNPLPEFEWENRGPTTISSMFIGYAKNSVAYRFMSLNDSSISESRDAEFFEGVFLLKKHDSTTVHETIHVHDNVHLSTFYSGVRISIDKPRRSKRPRVETSFVPDFLTNFLIKDFDVNFLSDEVISSFFIEED